MKTEAEIEALCKALADSGKMIEAGWLSYRYIVIPAFASETQIEETRRGFYMGAHHLFSSIMTILEPGREPTDKDLDRMTLISDELNAFVKSLSS